MAGGSKKAVQRRRQEDRVLKSSVGDFRNGVLNVRNILQQSAPQAAAEERGRPPKSRGKKKGAKKGNGKKKGGGKKRH